MTKFCLRFVTTVFIRSLHGGMSILLSFHVPWHRYFIGATECHVIDFAHFEIQYLCLISANITVMTWWYGGIRLPPHNLIRFANMFVFTTGFNTNMASKYLWYCFGRINMIKLKSALKVTRTATRFFHMSTCILFVL